MPVKRLALLKLDLSPSRKLDDWRNVLMGMNLRGQGGDNEPEVLVDMNTTPLIDVMLVLLVMLIITIPIQLHSVNMNLPVGKPPLQLNEPEVVKLEINAQNQVLWNGEVLSDRSMIEAKMRAAAAQADQPEIHIKPDRAAKYETVANILAGTQRVGLSKIGIVGAEQFAK
jgi:biopolymer transport protein ExbD